jgi:fatty acid-binding protein DegV
MSAEDRKKERLKKAFEILLKSNPITGYASKLGKLVKGKLTKEKEFSIEKLIEDLKEEQKESANKNNPSKEINKKKRDFGNYQKLRSSKDKKFQGHTGRDG